jgi:AcrR family transcriptional regulator
VADTRTRILEAAERLYAERGVDGVSLREITEAAGQRNNAAVHYHFGGRDELVRALFERRYAQLEARRAEMLADLDAAGRGDDIPSLVRVLVAPFAEAGERGDEGTWVRFVARLHEDPAFNPFAGGHPYAASDEATAASREVTARIRRALRLPPKQAEARFYLVTTMAVHAVADRHAMAAAGVGGSLPAGRALIDALVDAAVSVLMR